MLLQIEFIIYILQEKEHTTPSTVRGGPQAGHKAEMHGKPVSGSLSWGLLQERQRDRVG